MEIYSRRPLVLIADDDRMNRHLMVQILKADYDIKVASNGKEVLEMTRGALPDLLLLDVMMPEMDGFEVCRYLKGNEATAHIPVIFVTAKDEIKDEEIGFGLGASDFIRKPVHPLILAARVRAHLRLKFMHDYISMELKFAFAARKTADGE